MEILKVSGDRAHVVLDLEDVAVIIGSMTEALEAVDDWEFHTRIGVRPSRVRAMREQLAGIDFASSGP